MEEIEIISGRIIHVTKNDEPKVIIIVNARTLKYAPATPVIKINGMKITIVLNEDPIIAGRRYLMRS